MNKPQTKEEWAKWLAEEVRGFSVHKRNTAFYVEGDPNALMDRNKQYFILIREWNPLESKDQIFECVEKAHKNLGIFLKIELLYRMRYAAIIEFKGDERFEVIHESLNQAIAEALWEVKNGS